MAMQALYRKWRSQTFEDVIGQQHVTQTLKNAIETNRVGHAYLFTGPRGTGKTSTARILAKAVNCVGEGEKPCNACSICRAVTDGRLMDLIEIDAASNTSVDDIRDLRDKVGFRPGEARTKFYIIDEVHMLSKSAFNALLKTLEEPPDHVIFVLATTEPEKIPATILSRCQRFDFRRITVPDITGRLQFIVEQEGLAAEQAALTFMARQAGGSMRDAISLLDQLTAYGRDTITLDLLHSVLGTANFSATQSLVDALLAGDVTAGLEAINNLVNEGIEPKQFTLELLEYLRGLLLLKYGEGDLFLSLPPETVQIMRQQAGSVSPGFLLQATQRFNRAIKDFKLSATEMIIPQLPLELAFIESAGEQQPAAAIAAPPPRRQPASFTPKPEPAHAASVADNPASPPPPAPETAISVMEAGGQTALSKDELRRLWPRILEEVKKYRVSYQEYLKKPMVQDVEIRGSTIYVLFGPAYDMAMGRVKKAKADLTDVFQKILGKKWQIEFAVISEEQAGQAAPPPANAVADDAIVKEAVSLGGKIP